jgi:hypothetical protein
MGKLTKRQLEADRNALLRAFNTEGCLIFLDGRNEHGSHVIMSYPRNLPEGSEDDVNECAEEILVAAEEAGFKVGDFVWTIWNWEPPQIGDEGRVEFSGYWYFAGIDAEVSRLVLSTEKERWQAWQAGAAWARREALEEAAKVASSWSNKAGALAREENAKRPGRVAEGILLEAARQIESRIRALIEKEG